MAVCVVIGQAADMMQDLKTGFMLGARPIRQQYAQLCLTWLGSLLAVGALYLLWRNSPNGANGFGPGTDLPAPQASVLMGILPSTKPKSSPSEANTPNRSPRRSPKTFSCTQEPSIHKHISWIKWHTCLPLRNTV